MATATKPLALDESINTTELTPRNIADVLAEELEGIKNAIGGGGGSGGHTIISPDGTSMTQRAGLDFVDAHISDDAVNDETVVEIMGETTEVAFDSLNPSGTEDDGLYLFEDADATPLTADMVGYGNGTVKGALDDVLDVKQGTNNFGVLTIENVDYPLKRSVMHLTNVPLTNNKAVITLPCQGQDILSVVGRCWATTGGVDYMLPLGFNDGARSFQIYGTLTSTNATVQLVLGGTTTASDIVLVIEHT